MNFFTEREDGADGHLEVLQAPGDAHDRDAEQQAETQVDQGDLPPAQQDPEEVHHRGQAAGLPGAVHQLVAEGPEGVAAEFEELDAEGDADDGDAHHQPHEEIDQRDEQAAEHEPDQITEKFHNKTKIIYFPVREKSVN